MVGEARRGIYKSEERRRGAEVAVISRKTRMWVFGRV